MKDDRRSSRPGGKTRIESLAPPKSKASEDTSKEPVA